jgi:hypothetical protein
MALTLTPEQERRVRAIATQRNQPAESVLDELIPERPVEQEARPQSGKELVAALREQGLLGSYGDPDIDSVELARQIRREAERRARDNA